MLWRNNVLSYAFTDTRVGAEYTVITLAPRNTVHIIGDPDPVMACEMDFGSSKDGLQWIEYISDTQQGYAVSLNETIVGGYQDQYAIVNQFHLVILSPDVTAEAKYKCSTILAPIVQASAKLAILGKS